MVGKLGDGAVRIYQKYISRDYNQAQGSECLYTPSCSAYMRDSIDHDGFLQGALNGAMRLQRCSKDAAPYYFQDFGQTLINCPVDRLERRFQFETPGDLQRLTQVKNQIDRSNQLYRSGKLVASAQLRNQWAAALKDEVHFRVVDRPGRDLSQPTEFQIFQPKPREARVERATSGLRGALGAAAGALGGIMGGLVGALAFGAASLAGGAVLGVVAATGNTNKFNQTIAQKHGKATVHGLATLERKVGRVGHQVHARVNQVTGSQVAASIVGLAAGLPVALVAGLAHGIKLGASSGYLGGKILGTNLVGACSGAQGCSCGRH